ncbi:MAG TPA: hypothetical protein VFG15_03250 [Amycolatopsis sp.]|nr:hypothetical protein [Amycolatopsis sp.]
MPQITIPSTDVDLVVHAPALIRRFGHVVGVTCDDFGVTLTLRMHAGNRLTLRRAGPDWALGKAGARYRRRLPNRAA